MKLRINELPGVNGNAFSSSRRLLNAINFNKQKMITSYNGICEGIQFEPDEKEKGGIIVFSEEVNAIQLSSNKVINWLKQKVATIGNKINGRKTIDKIAKDNELIGWTVGNYLNGRYTAKDGTCYGEKSLSVEIIGVDTDTMIKIAEQLCTAFKQESVLLKDYSSNRILFVDGT